MALRTSLVIGGDAQGAEAALDAADASLEKTAESAQRLQKAFATADQAVTRYAAAQGRARAETEQAKAAFAAGELTLEQYNAQLLETKTALSLVAAQHSAAVNALRQEQAAMGQTTTSLGQARAAYTNLGRQIQDVAVMAQGGMNIGTILATQGGQIADAVSQTGGKFAALGRFMSGPWGTAIIVGASVLLNQLVPALMASTNEAEANAEALAKVKVGTSNLSDIQNVLGGVFDVTTGKMKDQTAAAMGLAKASIILAQAQARQRLSEADAKVTAAYSKQWDVGGGMGGGLYIGRKLPATWSVASNFRAGLINSSQAVDQIRAMRDSGKINDATAADLAASISSSESERSNLSRLDTAWNSLETGKLAPSLRRTPAKQHAGPKGVSAASMAEFGRDELAKIAAIRDQYSQLPTVVEQANKANRELDNIVGAINVKLADAKGLTKDQRAQFEGIKKAANDLRPVIEAALNKPFDDYMEKARQAEEIDRLTLAGKQDQAAALKDIVALQKQQGPLTDDQLKKVLETVQAERDRAMVIRDQQALIQANVQAVHDMRGALEQTVGGLLRGRVSIGAIVDSFANSFVTLTSKRVVESMFGDMLRQLEKEANGESPLDAASKKMATSLDDGSKAVDDFATSVRAAVGRINGTPAGAAAPASAAAVTPDLDPSYVNGNEINVTRERPKPNSPLPQSNVLVDMFAGVLNGFKLGVPTAIVAGLKPVLNRLETVLPGAIGGALTGGTVAKAVFGNSESGIGGAIGGAIGNKLGEKFLSKGLSSVFGKALGGLGGPIGSIVGGVLGGLVGGLFHKTKFGYAIVSDKEVSAGGNSAEMTANARASGDSLQSSINTIAQRLGAQVGSYLVSIASFDNGWIHVDSAGDPSVASDNGWWRRARAEGREAYDGKDPQAAMQAAIADAIKDGAIKGVSAAVQQALRSSPDIDKGLAEAIKVQQVELAIGGIQAQLDKAFKDFEIQAAERVRIAKQYGFDLVKLEQRNAEDRLRLTKQMLADQVGSLQQLVDDMTSGSLFEGSAVDQRQALLDKITAAKAEADAGTEGAADKLANLLQQLNGVSRDAFGTTGGFASDRSTILDAARDTIAKANQRVDAAASAAQAETNAALEENNAQNAQIIAALNGTNGLLGRFFANGTTFEGLQRVANLARVNVK